MEISSRSSRSFKPLKNVLMSLGTLVGDLSAKYSSSDYRPLIAERDLDCDLLVKAQVTSDSEKPNEEA